MPRAGGNIAAQVKYHYQDHDTDLVSEAPPVQNTWYEAFDAEDVRLIWCQIFQSNDEAAAKDVEVRWTIDGTAYVLTYSLANQAAALVFRDYQPAPAGLQASLITTLWRNAGGYVDKRGHSFKVEIRMTAVPGTNQTLICRCVRETLEET